VSAGSATGFPAQSSLSLTRGSGAGPIAARHGWRSGSAQRVRERGCGRARLEAGRWRERARPARGARHAG
jgi:hypothetical protein